MVRQVISFLSASKCFVMFLFTFVLCFLVLQRNHCKVIYQGKTQDTTYPLSCYELDEETLPDFSTKTSSWDKSIYFTESSCTSRDGKISITAKQACAVESAAFTNPDFDVHLIYLSPGTIKDNGSMSDQLLRILQSYKNIKILHLSFKDFIKNTPAEQLYASQQIQTSSFPVIVCSDITRLLLLQKFGGIYLDLDVVVLKSLSDLGHDFAGIMTESYINPAVVGYSNSSSSKLITQQYLEELNRKFVVNQWDYTGPVTLTNVIAKTCKSNKFLSKHIKDCKGFKLYPPEKFYPITWEHWKMYFEEQKSDDLLNSLLEKTYVAHYWNKMSSNFVVSEQPKSIFNTLAEKFCPRVFETAKGYF